MLQEITTTRLTQVPDEGYDYLFRDYENAYTGEVTRQFTTSVNYEASVGPWSQCTKAEKEEYEKTHSKETLEQRTVRYIREKYSVNQEYEVLRKQFKDPEAFAIYDAYVEECIEKAKKEIEE